MEVKYGVRIGPSLIFVSNSCGNSKGAHFHVVQHHAAARRYRQTQAAVICDDAWLTSTVTYRHNYDRALCYSYTLNVHPMIPLGGLRGADWTRCQVEYYNEQENK